MNNNLRVVVSILVDLCRGYESGRRYSPETTLTVSLTSLITQLPIQLHVYTQQHPPENLKMNPNNRIIRHSLSLQIRNLTLGPLLNLTSRLLNLGPTDLRIRRVEGQG